MRFKPEHQPLGAAEFGDAGIQAPRAFLPAEFPRHVIQARHAGPRHIRVQQERPPRHIHQQVRPPQQRAEKPAYAEIAPRAHEIVDDFDGEARTGWGQNIHGAILATTRTLLIGPAFKCVTEAGLQ